MTGINACPVELVSYICSLACTDDGATVQFLSLVSRCFYDICVPLRYHSVSLNKHQHIARFTANLDQLPSHLRRIHHLYISLVPETAVDLCEDIASIFHILELASPILESLTFIYPNMAMSSSTISRLFRTPLPNLRELSVHGFYPFPNSSTIQMPRLERLHLSGNRNPYGLLHMDCLHDCLPSLTHLRVSGLSMASSFATELDRAIQDSRELDTENENKNQVENSNSFRLQPFLVRLPQKLECIVVQPGSKSVDRVPTSNMKKDIAMIENLLHIVRCQNDWIKNRKEKEVVRVVLEDRMGDVSIKDVFYRDWVNRLDGGAGCWPH